MLKQWISRVIVAALPLALLSVPDFSLAATPCIKHDFVSGKADSADTTIIRPSDWNACHEIDDAAIPAAKLDFDPATQAELDNHINDTAAAHAASAISVDSTTLVGVGTDQQAVNEEFDNAIVAAEASIAAHIADSSAAHAASAISVSSTTLVGTGTDAQAVFEELDDAIVAAEAATAAHIADTSAAHAASAIGFTPNGSIAATDVQAAIQEVRDEAGDLTEVQATAPIEVSNGTGPVPTIACSTCETTTGAQTKVDTLSESIRVGIRTPTAIDLTIVHTTHRLIAVTSTAATRTITLPDSATALAGAAYTIVDESNGAMAVPIVIARAGTDTFIGGDTTKLIDCNACAVTFYTNGTGLWFQK